MTSTTTDRRSGASTPGTASDRLTATNGAAAYKAPCKAATTANITLSGLQTIDGVALAADDRVLVKDKSTASQNGIYLASSGNWERAPDWDDSRDVVEGTRVWVTDGTVNGQSEFVVTSAGPITPGTTSVTIEASAAVNGGALLAANDLSDVADPFTAMRNLMENGATIVCANPLVLTAAGGDFVDVSGNTNFSAVTLAEGKSQWVRFTGTPTITVGASLIGNGGGSNVTLAAGDIVQFRGYAAGVVRFVVHRLSGREVVPPAVVTEMQAGMIMDYAGANAPSKWLLCYGQAIDRTTYADLFTAIGTTYGSGDGSTTFNVPDLRGRVSAGQDDMGGTSANRLTNPASTVGGIDGDVLGGTGGAETHVITLAQMASHTHTYKEGGFNGPAGTNTDGSGGVTGSTGSAGSNAAHNNVQPTIILNKIIYTGVA